MSPSQLFHIPSALKRSHSKAVTPQQRPSDRRETKAEHILGVSEAHINTVRNKSISSVATTKLQGNLSDATTEFGTSIPRDGAMAHLPELRLKASSVLLHDEFGRDRESASSLRSSRLRNYDSSSTLNSHYDSQRAPLSVSQQTSDSSRRDFALRKGQPNVVQSTTQENDLSRQMRFFKSSKARLDGETKKLVKDRPRTGTTVSNVSLNSSRPPTSRTSPATAATSPYSARPRQKVQFTAEKAARPKPKNALLGPLDPATLKVNIRRPKAGAKHWFDGHEGDSSEEESIDEPAFEETFVEGLEFAFQSGRIRPPSDTSTITATAISSSISPKSTPQISAVRTPRIDQPPVIPRIAVLNAKASKSSLRPAPVKSNPKAPSIKRKTDPLAATDLSKTSMLNLSSSDDEDEPVTPQRAESALAGPALRDSVAIAFSSNSQIELGTAEAISAIPSGPDQSQVRTLKVVSQHNKKGQLHMPIPTRGSSRMVTQLADQTEVDDLIESFPATPIESVYSHRTSVRSSMAVSEVDSIESRRLMSVTKQEESLLAAMRLKKAAMKYKTTRDVRLEALRNLERGQSRDSHSTLSSNNAFVSATQLVIDTRPVPERHISGQHHHRRSLSNDERTHARASGTTFQTTTSRDASRLSTLTFRTERSLDNLNRLSLSSKTSQDVSRSPSMLSLNPTDRRLSRDTFRSSTSPLYSGHVRKPPDTSHVVALDDLDKIPKRDEIPSQEFIDWPYKGWEARAKVGLAH